MIDVMSGIPGIGRGTPARALHIGAAIWTPAGRLETITRLQVAGPWVRVWTEKVDEAWRFTVGSRLVMIEAAEIAKPRRIKLYIGHHRIWCGYTLNDQPHPYNEYLYLCQADWLSPVDGWEFTDRTDGETITTRYRTKELAIAAVKRAGRAHAKNLRMIWEGTRK